jgi:phosphosulfolactate synthase (CoM biosynthesis protein A)
MAEKNQADRPFAFVPTNPRPGKPRTRGLTEIRGPYYTPVGPHYLGDLLDAMGPAIDTFKFGGGSFRVMPRPAVRALIDVCHAHNVQVSTGGFLEAVLPHGAESVRRCLVECRELGFDIIEVSSGFLTVPADDLLRLVADVQKAGLKAKPEVGVQFGAGGATAAAELAGEGLRDPDWAIGLARRFLDAGADHIMIESEGITECAAEWRTDVAARFANALGLDRIMFEAADPAVFAWYVKTYGPDVNLFVDHSQVVQLECLRCGVWGDKSLWGRVAAYKD